MIRKDMADICCWSRATGQHGTFWCLCPGCGRETTVLNASREWSEPGEAHTWVCRTCGARWAFIYRTIGTQPHEAVVQEFCDRSQP